MENILFSVKVEKKTLKNALKNILEIISQKNLLQHNRDRACGERKEEKREKEKREEERAVPITPWA